MWLKQTPVVNERAEVMWQQQKKMSFKAVKKRDGFNFLCPPNLKQNIKNMSHG